MQNHEEKSSTFVFVFGAVGHVVVSAGSLLLGMKWHGSVYLVALAAGQIDSSHLRLQYFMRCSHEPADINHVIILFNSHLFR